MIHPQFFLVSCCPQQKAKVVQEHKISQYLDHILLLNKELEKQYADSDDLLKEELATMRGLNMFGSFYDTLNATREYHQKFPNAGHAHQARVVEEDINVPFSGEEVFGKYLDLHSFYLRY